MTQHTESTTHTPGPWIMDSGMVWTENPRQDGQFVPIARMDRDTEYTRPVERDANCRLCAAAPDLLAACEALRAELSRLCEDHDAYTDEQLGDLARPDYGPVVLADSAIAKARGEGV